MSGKLGEFLFPRVQRVTIIIILDLIIIGILAVKRRVCNTCASGVICTIRRSKNITRSICIAVCTVTFTLFRVRALFAVLYG